MDSLWGDEFQVPEKPEAKEIVKKIKKEKAATTPDTPIEKIVKSNKVNLKDKMVLIEQNVTKVLGKQIDNVQVVYKKDELHQYLAKGLEKGRIAIDTETNNSLDPITCKLMGLCLYVPDEKQVYVPVNHINLDNNERLDYQLTENDIHDELQWLIDNKGDCKFIFHNGKFDYQVIKCTCNVCLPIDYDTFLGAKMLDENEPAGLKYQYTHKIDKEQEKYSIEHLFEGLSYSLFKPDLFALYAATDAMMTDKLYLYQMNEFKKEENKGIFNCLMNIEVPVTTAVAEMELYGVAIDQDYAKRLSAKYHAIKDDIDARLNKELENIESKVNAWKLTPEANAKQMKNGKEGKSKAEQLSSPISITSPTQLAILFYDIYKVGVMDKKAPRGTGEDILNKIAEKTKNPLCQLILEKRGVEKLLGTYVDKIPEIVCPKDGRIHASFKQLGAATGRFASDSPNLQNIPAHAKDIRMLFAASPGKVMVGADFSQQEPRLLAWYAQDPHMIEAYMQKKDLYATVASKMYKNNYEDNLEHYPDGSKNPEGAARRFSAKAVVMGLLYGRGAASVAEQIGTTPQEAQTIINQFFDGFPKVRDWIKETQENCRQTGLVHDLWGRVRRLPDIQLPKYTIRFTKEKDESNIAFNPFLICKDKENPEAVAILKKYKDATSKIRGRNEYTKLKEEALRKDSVDIIDNGAFISQAERQSVNARVQGGAASISKRAMIAIFNDKKMKELDFHMMICVHDEIIGECPKENADQVAARLCELMIDAPKPECQIPMKCDAVEVPAWYYDEYGASILEKEYGNEKSDCYNDLDKTLAKHPELLKEQLINMLRDAGGNA